MIAKNHLDSPGAAGEMKSNQHQNSNSSKRSNWKLLVTVSNSILKSQEERGWNTPIVEYLTKKNFKTWTSMLMKGMLTQTSALTRKTKKAHSIRIRKDRG
jgi:hypothetical protein